MLRFLIFLEFHWLSIHWRFIYSRWKKSLVIWIFFFALLRRTCPIKRRLFQQSRETRHCHEHSWFISLTCREYIYPGNERIDLRAIYTAYLTTFDFILWAYCARAILSGISDGQQLIKNFLFVQVLGENSNPRKTLIPILSNVNSIEYFTFRSLGFLSWRNNNAGS